MSSEVNKSGKWGGAPPAPHWVQSFHWDVSLSAASPFLDDTWMFYGSHGLTICGRWLQKPPCRAGNLPNISSHLTQAGTQGLESGFRQRWELKSDLHRYWNQTWRDSLGVFRRNFNGPSWRFGLWLLNVYISDQIEQIGVCCVLCVVCSYTHIRLKSTIYDGTYVCELMFVRLLVSPALTHKLLKSATVAAV